MLIWDPCEKNAKLNDNNVEEFRTFELSEGREYTFQNLKLGVRVAWRRRKG